MMPAGRSRPAIADRVRAVAVIAPAVAPEHAASAFRGASAAHVHRRPGRGRQGVRGHLCPECDLEVSLPATIDRGDHLHQIMSSSRAVVFRWRLVTDHSYVAKRQKI